MRCVRIWFKKEGLAVYISHLDMYRTMTRAVRRAQIPLWYTEGFNPHPYMTFLMPLPLGQTALNEPVDIRIEGDMTDAVVMQRLNDVLPEGITVISVAEPVNKANEITFGVYSVSCTFGTEEQASSFASQSAAEVSSGTVSAVKKTKRGEKQVNLCEMIKSYSCTSDGNNVHIDCTISAGCSVNLNCDLLTETLFSLTGLYPVVSECTRTALLLENGEKFR